MDVPAPRIDSPAAERDAPSQEAALFRLLSDGLLHPLTALAERLGGSGDVAMPANIARTVAALRSLGMAIAVDERGVRTTPFVPLDAAAIRQALGPAQRWSVRVDHALDSTNAALMAAVRRDDRPPGPALVAAEIQSAGRGRMGRRWLGTPGAALAVSFAIDVARGLSRLDGVTLACGLAVQRLFAADGVGARLKWPNDILVDGRKVAGILVEAHATRDGTALVIGIGINVGAVPAAIDGATAVPPAALQRDGDAPIDRNRLVARLARALEGTLATFDAEGFAPLAPAWNAVDAFHDRAVGLSSSPQAAPVVGICRGVDATGALVVEVDGRSRRIVAGDVSLRPAREADRAA